jgi:DNA-nicking Smr family endonuclease
MSKPPHSRRHRALTEDERTLWHAVAKTTKPLKRGRRASKAAEQNDEVLSAKARAIVSASTPTSTHAKLPKRTEKPASPPALAPIGRRDKARLSRGRQEIDARIDLHGMTQARAHRALLAFLQRAHADGAVFVLVITGKGRIGGEEREQGVLRRQVPHWLALPEFRTIVVGYEQAHIGHGGEGALYVRVRRARVRE